MSTPDIRQTAHTYFREGMEEYDRMMIGEQRAKAMYLTLFALGAKNGMGGIMVGAPGSGKSMLLGRGHEIIEDIDDSMVADVPHRQSLQDVELVGQQREMKRTTISDGEAFTDTLSTEVTPILRPGIRVVKFDEISRTSPLALNAALGILQDGGIKVGHNGSAQQLDAGSFDMVVSSMNNFGTMFTNKLDPAIVSRHAMGVITGERQPGALSEVGESIWDDAAMRGHTRESLIDMA
jgi:MoxR-like ATPase